MSFIKKIAELFSKRNSVIKVEQCDGKCENCECSTTLPEEKKPVAAETPAAPKCVSKDIVRESLMAIGANETSFAFNIIMHMNEFECDAEYGAIIHAAADRFNVPARTIAAAMRNFYVNLKFKSTDNMKILDSEDISTFKDATVAIFKWIKNI